MNQLRQTEDVFGEEFELECVFASYRNKWKRNQVYLFIIASTNHDISIFAGKYLIRDDRGMRRAMSLRFLSCNEIIGRNVHEARNLMVLWGRTAAKTPRPSDAPVTRTSYSLSIHLSPSSDGR